MLSGFTLTEILITLTISAILISLVVNLFTYISEAQKTNDKKTSEYEEMLMADRVISDRISSADSIHFSQNCLTFFYKKDVRDEIIFNRSNIIINTRDYCDTLHLSTGDVECSFNRFAPGLVETVIVPITLNGQTIKMSFAKEYEGEIIVRSQTSYDEN
jgi:prepilin-type N-terminal cleavage/methylation domain-containing protein